MVLKQYRALSRNVPVGAHIIPFAVDQYLDGKCTETDRFSIRVTESEFAAKRCLVLQFAGLL